MQLWRFAVLAGALVWLPVQMVPAYSAGLSAPVHSRSSSVKRLGQVRAIRHGLTVRVPHRRATRGKVRQFVYRRYLLRTGHRQLASLRFRDGTYLHMNQQTDVTLRSPHLTYVGNGEVEEIVVPGTNHQVTTAQATTSAIGTKFDVRAQRGVTVITVVEGTVMVSSKHRTVEVQTGQQTTVHNGKPPSKPAPVATAPVTAWTTALPPAPQSIGENVALAANGGRIAAFSSQFPSPQFAAANAIDGRLDRGWLAHGVAGQFVKLGFKSNSLYTLEAVIIDPQCLAHPDCRTADLKQFELLISTSGTANSDFTVVARGTTLRAGTLQRFPFQHPVEARYLELIAQSDYGDPVRVAVDEIEVQGVPVSTGGHYTYSFTGLSSTWSYPSSPGSAPESLTVNGQGCGNTTSTTLTVTGQAPGSLDSYPSDQVPLGAPIPVFIEVGVDANFASYQTMWFVTIEGAGGAHSTATLTDQSSGPPPDLPQVKITTGKVPVKQTRVTSCP